MKNLTKGMNLMSKETKLKPAGEMEEVIWVDIKGFEEYYSINQFGNIKAKPRVVSLKNGGVRKCPQRILNSFHSRNHYRVHLCVNNHTSSFMVIRLLAEAFLGFDKYNRKVLVRNTNPDQTVTYYKTLEIIPLLDVLGEQRKSKLSTKVDRRKESTIWVDIKGYEGMYSVNQFGDVKSHMREVNSSVGTRILSERILESMPTKSGGTLRVTLSSDGVQRSYTVNQLVSEAFLGTDKDDDRVLIVRKDSGCDRSYFKNLRSSHRKQSCQL